MAPNLPSISWKVILSKDTGPADVIDDVPSGSRYVELLILPFVRIISVRQSFNS